MKAVWKGSITFALVSIPVKLYTAVRKRGVHFHMLHERCHTPLKYDRHCPSCDATVPWEDVTHGYEYEKGKFVVVTDEEMESLPLASARSIDILKFVDPEAIEPIYHDGAYYLEPEEGSERAYALLREAIRSTGRVPLAKLAMREKEHLAVIDAHGDALALHTLLYADEVVSPEALNVPGKTRLGAQELDLAKELVKRFTGDPNLEEYHDEFRDALMGLIKAKIEGKEVKAAPRREARKVISLMDALKKSLKEKEKKKKVAGKKKRKAG